MMGSPGWGMCPPDYQELSFVQVSHVWPDGRPLPRALCRPWPWTSRLLGAGWAPAEPPVSPLPLPDLVGVELH